MEKINPFNKAEVRAEITRLARQIVTLAPCLAPDGGECICKANDRVTARLGILRDFANGCETFGVWDDDTPNTN